VCNVVICKRAQISELVKIKKKMVIYWKKKIKKSIFANQYDYLSIYISISTSASLPFSLSQAKKYVSMFWPVDIISKAQVFV